MTIDAEQKGDTRRSSQTAQDGKNELTTAGLHRMRKPFTIVPMPRCSRFRFCVLLAMLGLIVSSLSAGGQQKTSNRGRKFKMPPPTARIEVTVVRDVNQLRMLPLFFTPWRARRTRATWS
jgi:hypothetical protein